MTSYEVRKMRRADLEAVGVLAGRLVRMHHEFDAKRFLDLANPEAGYARYFASEIDRNEVVLLVAVAKSLAGAEKAVQAIVGYAYARLEPRSYNELLDACGKLHDVYVDEAWRGRGVGSGLVREAVARLEALGAPRVVLLTAEGNAAAQKMFARLGFRTTMLEMTREAT